MLNFTKWCVKKYRPLSEAIILNHKLQWFVIRRLFGGDILAVGVVLLAGVRLDGVRLDGVRLDDGVAY